MWGKTGSFIIQLDTCPATQKRLESLDQHPQTEMMLIRLDWEKLKTHRLTEDAETIQWKCEKQKGKGAELPPALCTSGSKERLLLHKT